MIHITSLDDGLETFKALGSDTRIQILNILLENEQMSMNQLATELNISNGALTGHIKKLEECGLINISNESAGHGNQKMCSVTQDRIIVDIKKPIDYKNVFETEIKVGQFSRRHRHQGIRDRRARRYPVLQSSGSFYRQHSLVHQGVCRIYHTESDPVQPADHAAFHLGRAEFGGSRHRQQLAVGYQFLHQRHQNRHVDVPWRLRRCARYVHPAVVAAELESVRSVKAVSHQ